MSVNFDTGIIESHLITRVRIPPVFASEVTKGIYEKLNQLLLKYSDPVNGVLISYDNVKVLNDTARILYDSPFLHLTVSLDVLSFSPEVGCKLSGVVSKQSAGHVAVLVNGIINATVAAEDMDGYYWSNRENCWVKEDRMLEVDGKVKFYVKAISVHSDLMTVSGTMKKVKKKK